MIAGISSHLFSPHHHHRFDRGLSPLDGLPDARKLLTLRALVEAQEGGPRSSSLDLSSLSLSASDGQVVGVKGAAAATTDTDAGLNGGKRRPPSLREVKVPRLVFRGPSSGSMSAGAKGAQEEDDGSEDGDGGEGQEEEEEDGDLAELVAAANRVRVHHTVKMYALEMLEEGVLEDVVAFVRADPTCRVVVTGYV